ncbi:vWA domain-containing protein [Candidatus Chrysopegis kryptomonas]|uniref:von Willebrand factor type A domain-containing protein n=1 Tax=Candidatus Chryseopegocella kryptomonas TaxID=1633643 RepID=A0A0P1MMK5_9BACT|nr:vWA domain-containing protein [Candidatus Chrysopegis kryptomonas]CUS96967.1 von Willebrand factor type A domain-containing protein [Candidatus Chrysopegis kryptomonas]
MKSLSFSANLFLVLIAILFSISVALLSYYKISIAERLKKLTLLTLIRASAVFLTFLLIAEPILTLIIKSEKPPTVAILIDNSKSMGIRDGLGDRKKITREIVEKLTKMNIPGDKKFFTFATDVSEKENIIPDSLTFSGGLTDITKALKKVKEISEKENVKSIILVSDGVYNSGENPVYFSDKMQIPTFTVGVGDSSVQKDLKIVDVIANDVAYTGMETPVMVKIESSQFEVQNVQVSLYDEKKEIAREKITLSPGINQQIVNFKFVPQEEGMKKFTVKIQQLPNEISYQNNQKSFYVKVLKGKHKILILSGAPSPDLAFIKRVIAENKNYEIISYIEKRGKDFIEGNFDFKKAEECDAIVLIGFPVKTSDVEVINKIKEIIASRNKPVLFVMSRNIDFERLKILSEFLPFRFSRTLGEEEVINLSITEDGRNHAVMDLRDKNHIWNLLPPIFKIRGLFTPSAGSIVLAKAKYQNFDSDDPLILANNLNNRKMLSILCYGIWRWKLLTAQNEEFSGVFETFINNAIRWLLSPAEEEFVKFKIAKNFFSEDEKVEFSAQVYSEDYSPINDAEIKVKILNQENGEQIGEINLEQIGSGIYSGGIQIQKGDYRYEASILRRGKLLKNFSGRFTVGETEIEFLKTQMDAGLLREIAQRTGGVFITSEKIDILTELISSQPNFKPEIVEKRDEFILWSRFEPLIAIIILLSIEWYLRKRYGLA